MNHFDIINTNGDTLRVAVKELLHSSRSPYQEIIICDTAAFGRCLLLDGVIQCAESDHEIYDHTILRKLRPTDRRVLILGGGDGYIAELALQIHPELNLTVVDMDSEVVSASRKYLGQQMFEHQQVELVIDDAFRFLRDAEEAAFDGVICDLTDFPVGYNDGKLRGFFTQIFELAKRVLKQDGWIGVYAGCKNITLGTEGYILDILSNLLEQNFAGIERMEAEIPSFGEPCYFLYGAKVVEGSRNFKIEVVTEATDDLVNQLLELGKATYPVSSNGENTSEYYADLNNENYINIILKDRGGIIVGYLLAVPHDEACLYQKERDPFMSNDPDRYYVDSMQIASRASKSYSFMRLLNKMFEEAKKKGLNQFSLHARKSNGLSRLVLKRFPISRIVRTIDNFETTGEPFDYIEAEI